MIIKVDDEIILDLCCASDLAIADDVVDPKQWIADCIIGKMQNAAVKMIERWKSTLMSEDQELSSMTYEEAQVILNNPELVIPRIVACPSYKNRADRYGSELPIG